MHFNQILKVAAQTKNGIIVSFVLLEFFSLFTRALFQGIQTQPMLRMMKMKEVA
ncbi:hypothetical protein Hdeb2414_s0278g00855621 [Helianthus debilis subsp. tardiflorus]